MSTSRKASGIGRDPQIDFGDLRTSDDSIGLARRNDRAGMQDREAIDHGDECMNHVLDPDDRYTGLPHLLDERHEARTFGLGETARNLIEQQHAWLRGQRPREFEPLAVDEGERPDEPEAA